MASLRWIFNVSTFSFKSLLNLSIACPHKLSNMSNMSNMSVDLECGIHNTLYAPEQALLQHLPGGHHDKEPLAILSDLVDNISET